MRSYDSTEFYSTSSVITLVHLHATVYRSYLSLNKVATGNNISMQGPAQLSDYKYKHDDNDTNEVSKR